MTTLRKRDDRKNLARELASNRTDALEIVREALTNAKDHQAERVFIRSFRDARAQITLVIADDGQGLNDARFEAFMGIGSTDKPGAQNSIGYKGHGTKLYLECKTLLVASRTKDEADWRYTEEADPLHNADRSTFEVAPLPPEHRLRTYLNDMELRHGTLICMEGLECEDGDAVLQRKRIESYCDWYTVVGDIRSGLFETRSDFHRALLQGESDLMSLLRHHEVPLRPLDVHLRINGEPKYTRIGASPKSQGFFSAWPSPVNPEILAFGHRFADVAQSSAGAVRGVVDDTSAVRLTAPDDWYTDTGIAIVAHVEGNRRQILTYPEASWQNHSGLFTFKERWGLWLCRDFVPVVQRNELLERALEKSASRLSYEFKNLRNWKVFINDQALKPTANRTDIANRQLREQQIVEALVGVLGASLKKPTFRAWIEKLQSAKSARMKQEEIDHAETRRDEAKRWISKTRRKGIDPLSVSLPLHQKTDSLPMREPESEQELVFLYGVLSGRYRVPIQLFSYDAHNGIDAIGSCIEPRLVPVRSANPFVRIEFKFEVEAGRPIDHYFASIDVLICWKVGKSGQVFEVSSTGQGTLKRRKKSVLSSGLDTHEIVYLEADEERTIPVLELRMVFREKEDE